MPVPIEPSSTVGSARAGLPQVNPDFVEQEMSGEIDNIVPTRGYKMLPIVALGGSAGSIPALQRFFQAMSPSSGMAFVVVLHLSPDFHSTLPEILGRCTKMRVVQAQNGDKVEANCVYVIPPGKHLSSTDGQLRLSDLEPEKGRRIAVDLFFRSLADTHGPHALAVILSGADGDGAIGIKRIKERGGLTIAQDPEEAEYSSMPRTAIATGMVDWVLGVAQMPSRLLEYNARERRLRVPPEEGPSPASPPAHASDEVERALREVLVLLRTRTNRDFSCYKRATIVRRIARRLQVNGLEDLPAYVEFLRIHPGEAGALLQDLLISVTNFFRDHDSFDVLERMIPELFRNKAQSETVRVWVPACATGEEAYSIAMLLLEHARKIHAPPKIQVFSCDLDNAAIQVARTGVYPEAITADVSEERLQQFFIKEQGGYRVQGELREAVIFATHDLLKNVPFSRMDLVSCRNLLIYLNQDAQRRAVEVFHFALRQNGLLFLGSSESIEEDHPHFGILDKNHRLYIHKVTGRVTLPAATPSLLASEVLPRNPLHLPGQTFSNRSVAGPVQSARDRISFIELHFKLVERLAPPSMVINAEYEIVHLSPSAGRFLQMAGGEPTINLLSVVNPMLRIELRAALFRSAQTAAPVEVTRVPVDLAEGPAEVDMRVSPAGELAPGFVLVSFEPRSKSNPDGEQLRSEPEPIVRQLESELEHLKGQLRHKVAEYETNLEELTAGNEELTALNEELRSASEELENSREEMQSINEELTTVNHELKGKLDELGQANSDLQNLISSTAIATVFVDRELRILRYTPPAVEIFNVIPSDIGRPLQDLRDRLLYPELGADAERVLQELIPIDREVTDQEGRWYLARLVPYLSAEERISGVVLNFVDISRRKNAELTLRHSEKRYHVLFNSMDEGFCVIKMIFDDENKPVDYRFLEVNPSFERHTGLERAGGRTMREMVPDHEEYWFEIYGKVALTGQSVRFRRKASKLQRWYDVYAFRFSAPEDRQVAILFTDITEQQRAEEAFAASQERLQLIVENAREFAIFSTDLNRRVTSWNSGAERMLGYTEEEIVGETADIIFTNEDCARGAPDAEAHRAITEDKAVDERWHARKDRSRFWGSGYLMAMRDREGKVIGFVKILHDRTEAKRTEEELSKSRAQLEAALKEAERAREEAENAGRTKDHFLATLSHELRTPLTPVLITAESLLRRKDLPARAFDGLQVICRNIEVQTHFIDDLLDVTRISRGKFEITREPFYVHNAVRGALEICQPDLAAKGQELSVDLQAADCQSLGDFTRIQQVFWNLLKNASKFTPDAGRISITSRNEPGWIIVAVSDTGMGIDPNHLTDIFDAFQQADTSITRKYGGLGLGLAIAKATVEGLGGSIFAESAAVGSGATFTVKLPLIRSVV